LPGERNPQSAAEEFAPTPQGDNVLDASMMAELIVTKKEIVPQLKKSTGTSRARPKSLGAGGQLLPLAGRHGAEHSTLWFLGSGALWVGGGAVSVRTPAEGQIGADTAAWTQGYSRPFARSAARAVPAKRSRLDMDCGASVQSGRVGRVGRGFGGAQTKLSSECGRVTRKQTVNEHCSPDRNEAPSSQYQASL
jgi:hypothetical protein